MAGEGRNRHSGDLQCDCDRDNAWDILHRRNHLHLIDLFAANTRRWPNTLKRVMSTGRWLPTSAFRAGASTLSSRHRR